MWIQVLVIVAVMGVSSGGKYDPICDADWFGCPTRNCKDDWEQCGFGVVVRNEAGRAGNICCHSIGSSRTRVCRYRSTARGEYPSGSWWDQYCLPIYPSYAEWD